MASEGAAPGAQSHRTFSSAQGRREGLEVEVALRIGIQVAQRRAAAEPFSSASLSLPPGSSWGRTQWWGLVNMESQGAGTAESSSRLEAPAPTDDRLFLVKGVVRCRCWGELTRGRSLHWCGHSHAHFAWVPPRV